MLSHLKIGTRLTILTVLMALFMSVIGIIGLRATSAAVSGLKTVYEDRTVPLIDLGKILDNVHRIRVGAVTATSASSQDVVKEAIGRIQQRDQEIGALWSKYMATTLTPEEKQLADAFGQQWKIYQESRDRTMSFASAGDFEAARENAKNDAGPKYSAVHETLFKLIELQGSVAKEEFDRAQASYAMERAISIGAIVGGVAFGLLLAWRIIRSITGPMNQMRATITEVEKSGDFTRRVPVSAQDEVGQTAQAFNNLMAELQQALGKVLVSVGQVSGSAQTLSGSSQQVASSSTHQSEATSSMAAAVEEMTVSINHVSDSARQALEISQKTGQLSSQGGGIIHDTVREMNQIAETVRQTAQTIEELGQHSNQISSIVQVIKDVADQTNLLALNAAIEAARAGEQGRGFAVVADEVRKLAERTTKATEEITRMIATIQDSAQAAVSTMGEAVTQVGGGVALAQQAGDAINQIRDGAEQVVHVVNDISSALTEQSAASNDIAGQVETVAQMTEENSAAAAETASAASHLGDLANTMQAAVSRFKI